MERKMVPYDGNSAVAHVAHATNEIIAIYPITPSTPMARSLAVFVTLVGQLYLVIVMAMIIGKFLNSQNRK